VPPAEGEPLSDFRPHYEDVFVEPQSLAEFATLVGRDLGALQDAWANVREEMGETPSPNFPGEYTRGYSNPDGYPELTHEGSGGMREGREFYRAYFLTIGAELSLVRDAMRGLETLQRAAQMIHNGYQGTDESSASNLAIGFEDYERSAVLEALGAATDPVEGGTGDEQR
jgi:hypothetical protein